MKRMIALTFALTLTASPTLAASLSDPVIAPEVIAAETEAASTNKLDATIPTFFLVLLVLNLAGALN